MKTKIRKLNREINQILEKIKTTPNFNYYKKLSDLIYIKHQILKRKKF